VEENRLPAKPLRAACYRLNMQRLAHIVPMARSSFCSLSASITVALVSVVWLSLPKGLSFTYVDAAAH
jgi:hypothetical protein